MGQASETFGKQCTPVPYGRGGSVCCRAEVSRVAEIEVEIRTISTLGGVAPTD
ncbi:MULTISPECIES: hypothetical protein [Streptomyces]|uniref:Uncharacterized protein n=1 Tax=Streptomyces tendae TaxID=1932 RepID=A0A6B3QIQ9_STRTE|nr:MULTISPECIES: hypothetical protein [Streptomyces]BET50428.1 hypothetical protein RGQ21_54100 [Kitasatospora aureofaciens]MBQ0967791.1 hypothetical protein [Streptomyces sp. RK74B]MBQ1004555.1 hypothetical protein [Streptomyces sp. RK23]MCW1093746.1 hypothetical protein [Streptomyces sp. RS2]NEV87130.1 hypothetical protein [Streptomyces tendae]